MKTSKIILAAAIFSLVATSAMAAAITASTSIGGGVFTPSTKVGLSVASASNSYAAASAHLNGTFQYGTGGCGAFTGDASKILQATIPGQTGTVGAPTPQTSATALTGTWPTP